MHNPWKLTAIAMALIVVCFAEAGSRGLQLRS